MAEQSYQAVLAVISDGMSVLQVAEAQQPAAAKVLATMLEKLRSASVHGRRGGLALVRTMTEKGRLNGKGPSPRRLRG